MDGMTVVILVGLALLLLRRKEAPPQGPPGGLLPDGQTNAQYQPGGGGGFGGDIIPAKDPTDAANRAKKNAGDTAGVLDIVPADIADNEPDLYDGSTIDAGGRNTDGKTGQWGRLMYPAAANFALSQATDSQIDLATQLLAGHVTVAGCRRSARFRWESEYVAEIDDVTTLANVGFGVAGALKIVASAVGYGQLLDGLETAFGASQKRQDELSVDMGRYNEIQKQAWDFVYSGVNNKYGISAMLRLRPVHVVGDGFPDRFFKGLGPAGDWQPRAAGTYVEKDGTLNSAINLDPRSYIRPERATMDQPGIYFRRALIGLAWSCKELDCAPEDCANCAGLRKRIEERAPLYRILDAIACVMYPWTSGRIYYGGENEGQDVSATDYADTAIQPGQNVWYMEPGLYAYYNPVFGPIIGSVFPPNKDQGDVPLYGYYQTKAEAQAEANRRHAYLVNPMSNVAGHAATTETLSVTGYHPIGGIAATVAKQEAAATPVVVTNWSRRT